MGWKKWKMVFLFINKLGVQKDFRHQPAPLPQKVMTARATRRSLLMNLSLRAMAWSISTVLAGQKTTIRTASCQTLSSLAMEDEGGSSSRPRDLNIVELLSGYEKSFLDTQKYINLYQSSRFQMLGMLFGPSSDPRSKKKNDCGNWRNKDRLVNCREWRNLLSIALQRLGTRDTRAPCSLNRISMYWYWYTDM